MIRILANDGISEDGKSLLEEAGFQVDTKKIAQEDLPKALPEYDVLIVRSATKVRKDLIDQCPRLKVIARGGVGLDNIDVEYAQRKGIEVYNTPAASSQSVAELVFAHIFTLSRFLHRSNREMPVKGASDFKALKKAYGAGIQLQGKTLGIVGFGRIGQSAARIALAMGMSVVATDPFVDDARIDINVFHQEGVSLSVNVATVDMDEVLKKSDFITLHVPGGDKPLIDREALKKVRKGVFLINTARGGTIEEEALLEALENGTVAGAGLDVFENEPTPRKELLNHPRISVSPHIGAATTQAQDNIGLELADKIIGFFEA